MRPIGPIRLTVGGVEQVKIPLDIYIQKGQVPVASVGVNEGNIGTATYTVEATRFPAFADDFDNLAVYDTPIVGVGGVYDINESCTVIRVSLTPGDPGDYIEIYVTPFGGAP